MNMKIITPGRTKRLQSSLPFIRFPIGRRRRRPHISRNRESDGDWTEWKLNGPAERTHTAPSVFQSKTRRRRVIIRTDDDYIVRLFFIFLVVFFFFLHNYCINKIYAVRYWWGAYTRAGKIMLKCRSFSIYWNREERKGKNKNNRISLRFRSVLFVGTVATITGAVDERGLCGSRSGTDGVEVAHPPPVVCCCCWWIVAFELVEMLVDAVNISQNNVVYNRY